MFNWSRLAKIPLWLRFTIFSALTLAVFWFAWRWWLRVRPARVLTHAATFLRDAREPRSLSDPFGLAIDGDGTLFVSDGLGELKRVAPDGTSQTLTKALHTPSFIALAADNKLIVADSGAHTIHRVDRTTGAVELLAGTPNQSGRRDGPAAQAKFNAPVGVAVNDDGLIFIADTYNDRICTLDANGEVKTLATGFHTPTGLVVAADGALLVADTGHHRIARVTMDGTVTTLAGVGEVAVRDGKLSEAAFDQPTGLAWRRDGALAISEAGSATIRLLNFGNAKQGIEASVTTLAGGFGWRDGALNEARFQYPTGLAFNADDVLFVADSGNGAVRALLPDAESYGQAVQSEAARVPPEKLRVAMQNFWQNGGMRWPFYPFEEPREIAGTFGEIRGVSAPNEDAWFHNGLDIPGAYGEIVYAIYPERVTRLLAVEGVGETRERLRLPLFGYIHVRIGRDQNDQQLPSSLNVQFLRDAEGNITEVRVPRGTLIRAGLAVGTLNRLNHVHLIAGPASSEVNALAALPLPGISDTVKPVIESVAVISVDDATYDAAQKPVKAKNAKTPATVMVQGRQRIIVTAYDQADGNASYRRLGLYRLGYQVLRKDGSPIEGFASPRFTLTFDRLPQTPDAARMVYATGSQSGYTGQTIFAYQVTNELRDGVVSEGSWDTTTLAAGDYVVRVFAEDFFRNQTTRDLAVRVLR